MPRTLGYHYVKSGYGLWLPGDDRGSWSEAWDEQIGFTEPHTLNSGDPVRQRMAQERMKHEPVRLDAAMIDAVVGAIDRCASSSPWRIAAASIESTHMHLLITYSGLDIKRTVKWLAQQATKAVHRQTDHVGPVWCEGYWCSYVFDTAYWTTLVQYIQRHNLRHRESANHIHSSHCKAGDGIAGLSSTGKLIKCQSAEPTRTAFAFSVDHAIAPAILNC